ncbi:MAG TPA: ABC transporter permease [Candidatus Sulfopaludibacter sp.]|jgi:putative ABC transport system permease protein|nr:ABC transporter permease [Candidatus Sulfopaludibacter sp.]
MGVFGQDLRHGARIFGKSPAVTAIALIALALGIGTSTAIFSVVDTVLLKPLPFRDAQQLVVVWEKSPARNLYRMYVARSNFWEWSRQSRTLQGMAAIQEAQINLTGGPNGHMEPEELKAERVSAGLFPLLGVQAVVGRVFRPEEDQPGHVNFALLSHRLWQRRFGADAAIAGKSIRLREQNYTVVGVLPGDFALLEPDVDVWVPLGLNPNDARLAGSRTLRVIARLRPGASLEQARSEMDTIGSRLEQSNPGLNGGYRPNVYAIREELAGKTRQPLLVLSGAVGLLLLMACANVASLLLARGASRRKEIAVRFALGATRGRVVRQLLLESVLLALAGGVLGLAVARLGIGMVHRFGPEAMPQLKAVAVDGRLFLFALGVSLATGIVFGILPAIHNSTVELSAALGETSRGGTASRTGRKMRSGLVVLEVALAVLVLIGAGLLVRSFSRLRAVNPGFQPRGLLTVRLPLLGGRNGAMERRAPFVGQAIESLAALPGVQSAAAVTSLPLAGLDVGSVFWVAGRNAPPPDQRPQLLVRYISGGYFSTMGIPLIAGRSFANGDTPQAPPVVVVNQSLARRFFPGENAVGQRLTLDSLSSRVAEIVGIAGDVKQEKVVGEDWPMAYLPYTQLPPPYIVMAMRTAGDPASLAGAATQAIHKLDPDQVVTDQRTMQDVMDRAVAEPRFDTAILTFLASVAFLLSAVGIYGVISYDVNDRVHELGIRMALGAQRGDVLRLVVGQGARLAALGILMGLAGALALTRLMGSMLYGVQPTDFFTFATISLLLGAVALAASYIPSRRAMALDPVVALRHE